MIGIAKIVGILFLIALGIFGTMQTFRFSDQPTAPDLAQDTAINDSTNQTTPVNQTAPQFPWQSDWFQIRGSDILQWLTEKFNWVIDWIATWITSLIIQYTGAPASKTLGFAITLMIMVVIFYIVTLKLDVVIKSIVIVLLSVLLIAVVLSLFGLI